MCVGWILPNYWNSSINPTCYPNSSINPTYDVDIHQNFVKLTHCIQRSLIRCQIFSPFWLRIGLRLCRMERTWSRSQRQVWEDRRGRRGWHQKPRPIRAIISPLVMWSCWTLITERRTDRFKRICLLSWPHYYSFFWSQSIRFMFRIHVAPFALDRCNDAELPQQLVSTTSAANPNDAYTSPQQHQSPHVFFFGRQGDKWFCFVNYRDCIVAEKTLTVITLPYLTARRTSCGVATELTLQGGVFWVKSPKGVYFRGMMKIWEGGGVMRSWWDYVHHRTHSNP